MDGIIPPRIAIVDGGRNTVECSWREKRGIGASDFHTGERSLEGMDDAKVTSQAIANNIGLKMDRYMVVV